MFQLSPISGKSTLYSKSTRNLKRTFLFLCFWKKRRLNREIRWKRPKKEERRLWAFTHEWSRAFTESPLFQVAAASSPRRKAARIWRKRARAQCW